MSCLMGCCFNIKALILDCDMGVKELLLGPPTINSPGVTMVVRNDKAYLTMAADLNEFI